LRSVRLPGILHSCLFVSSLINVFAVIFYNCILKMEQYYRNFLHSHSQSHSHTLTVFLFSEVHSQTKYTISCQLKKCYANPLCQNQNKVELGEEWRCNSPGLNPSFSGNREAKKSFLSGVNWKSI
jgi:hypothetical protein